MPEIHKIGATFILMLSIADVVLPLPVYGDPSMKGKKGKKGKGRATKKEGARKKNS